MSALSVRLPESLHQRVRELAVREGISINQLIATALAEKMSALMTADYLEERARRGSRAKFLAALAQVPDVEPEAHDRLPAKRSGKGLKPAVAGKGTKSVPRQTRIRR